jgi:hypothetical protein
MLSAKALRNQKRLEYLVSKDIKSKPVKIIECDEDSQIFNWQRTYKKASHKHLSCYDKTINNSKTKKNDNRKNKNRSKL